EPRVLPERLAGGHETPGPQGGRAREGRHPEGAGDRRRLPRPGLGQRQGVAGLLPQEPGREVIRPPGGTAPMGETEKDETAESEWRAKLTPEQYRVLREKGTERAFTGLYCDTKTPGVYRCAGCGQELFESDVKFDSG